MVALLAKQQQLGQEMGKLTEARALLQEVVMEPKSQTGEKESRFADLVAQQQQREQEATESTRARGLLQ